MEDVLETVLECSDLDAMATFLIDELCCRVDIVTPADDPAEMALSGPGIRLRVVRTGRDVAGHLRLRRRDVLAGSAPRRLVAPNGTVVDIVSASTDVVLPPSIPTLSVVTADSAGLDPDAFGTGRAGMGYRDLLPDRWGGRFIASHILIADGGDVADWVHYHRIRFQMIFVASGWVDVVYEDQGEPFRMHAGDCTLQPPEIRHRVLRSSAGLEVIEIGCPAQHDTVAEHTISLPTPVVDPDRDFGGQRFVRHIAAGAPTVPSVTPGFSERDCGIADATSGLADVRVLRVITSEESPTAQMTHDGEFVMYVVLAGSATMQVQAGSGTERVVEVNRTDAVTLPPAATWSWSAQSADLELLQVSLPASCIHEMSTVGSR